MPIVGSGHITNTYISEGYIAGAPVYQSAYVLELIDEFGVEDYLDNFSIGKYLEDNPTMSDTVLLLKTYYRSLTDRFNVTEMLRKQIAKIVVDAVNVVDSITTFRQFTRTFIESVTVSELLTLLKTYHKDLEDNVTVSDSIQRSVAIALEDNAITEDSITKVTGYLRLLNDTVTISDSLETICTKIKLLNDSLTVSDSLTKFIQKIVTDSVTISEKIIKYKNGIPLVWEYLKSKAAAIWNFKTNPTGADDWSKKVNIDDEEDWNFENNPTGSDDWIKSTNLSEEDDWNKKDNVT